MACSDIHDGEKQGHEHTGGVVGAQRVVDAGHDACWRCISRRCHLDHGLCNGHEQSCRHAFTGHVADHQANVVFIDQEIIIEIPADFARRFEQGVQVEFLMIGKGGKFLGQHAHLDRVADVQFFLHAIFLLLDDRVC